MSIWKKENTVIERSLPERWLFFVVAGGGGVCFHLFVFFGGRGAVIWISTCICPIILLLTSFGLLLDPR